MIVVIFASFCSIVSIFALNLDTIDISCLAYLKFCTKKTFSGRNLNNLNMKCQSYSKSTKIDSFKQKYTVCMCDNPSSLLQFISKTLPITYFTNDPVSN